MNNLIKKARKNKIIFFLAILLCLLGASLIPVLRLETKAMSRLDGQWVEVFYETEEAAAKDVFHLAEERSRELAQKLGFLKKQKIYIYIYDNQFTFQTKKYGLITALLGLDWYIGDNRGTNVLLTSPARPGPVHNYENNKQAALHEMVHAYNYLLNPGMPLWLNEGVASYLTNGNPPDDLYDRISVPSMQEMQTVSSIRFSNMGGYDFACTYIEFLDRTYGWPCVLTLLRTQSYEKAFQNNSKIIYDDWMQYLKQHYSKA